MESFPGRDIFSQRSELNVPANGLLALLTLVISIVVGVAFFRVFDGMFAGATLVSTFLVIGAGQMLVAQVIVRRAGFKARWAEHAYAVAFRWFLVPGLTLVFVGAAHFGWIEGERVLPREIALVPVLYLLASGVILWVRAIIAFGIHNLSLLYVYYPSESRLVQSNVYSVLRHPVYSAVFRIIFALVLWNGSAFALLAGCVAPLAMTVWLRWVEEAELIERFGEGYRDYRRRVPALFNFDPRTWGVLWRFLVRGK
jgi:protein-S-isoprenylcysteine O-methyltransferase Ste14